MPPAWILRPAAAFLAVWHRCIEEFGEHRQQQVGARQDAMKGRGLAHMRRGRQHRKRGARQTGQVAVPLATAQQSEELHHVCQA